MFLILPFPVAARADSLRDLEIAARVLSFQRTAPRGEVRVAIVYEASQPKAKAEAEALAARARPRVAVGSLKVEPVPVAQSALATTPNLSGVLALAGVDADALRSAMSQLRVPCVTTDLALVRAGSCAVAIRSEPKVQITINTHSASQQGVEFATAFLMMVQEI